MHKPCKQLGGLEFLLHTIDTCPMETQLQDFPKNVDEELAYKKKRKIALHFPFSKHCGMSNALNQLLWIGSFVDLTFTIVFSDVICQYEVDNQWGSWHQLMHHKWYCLLTDSLLAPLLIYLCRELFVRRGSNIVRKESATWMDPLKTPSDKSDCVQTSHNMETQPSSTRKQNVL